MKANTRKTNLELWVYAFKKPHENFYLGEHNTAIIKSLLHCSGVSTAFFTGKGSPTRAAASHDSANKGESRSGSKDEERET